MHLLKVLALAPIVAGLSLAYPGFDACKGKGEAGLAGIDLGCFFNYSMAAFALLFMGHFRCIDCNEKGKRAKEGEERGYCHFLSKGKQLGLP